MEWDIRGLSLLIRGVRHRHISYLFWISVEFRHNLRSTMYCTRSLRLSYVILLMRSIETQFEWTFFLDSGQVFGWLISGYLERASNFKSDNICPSTIVGREVTVLLEVDFIIEGPLLLDFTQFSEDVQNHTLLALWGAMQLRHALLKQTDLLVAIGYLPLDLNHLTGDLLRRLWNICLNDSSEHGSCALPRSHLIWSERFRLHSKQELVHESHAASVHTRTYHDCADNHHIQTQSW